MVARASENTSVAYIRVKLLTFLVLWIFIVSTIFITWQYTAFEVIEGEPTNKSKYEDFLLLDPPAKEPVRSPTQPPAQEEAPTLPQQNWNVVWITSIRASYGQAIKKENQQSAGFAEEAINFIIPLCQMFPRNFGWQEEGPKDSRFLQDTIWLELDVQDKELLLRCNKRGEKLLAAGNERKSGDNSAYIVMIQFMLHDLKKELKNYPETDNFDWIITRSMFETSALPKVWKKDLNDSPNEIWVPSTFLKGVYEQGGVERVVTVIGEGFNTLQMDPSLVTPNRGKFFPGCRDDDYVFLTVSKSEERKGYDHLLDAFIAEFSQEDAVCLAFRCNGLSKKIQQNKNIIGKTNYKLFLRNSNKVPRVATVARVPEAEYSSLLGSANVFVLATHGEGWGRTIVDSMAVAVPVIVPLWGGVTEYLTPNISIPIVVKETEKVPKGFSLAIKKNLDQHHWAKIEVDEVRKSLRWAYDHPAEARQVGLRGQEAVWEKWTRESVALSAADRFTEIAKMIQAKHAKDSKSEQGNS